MKKYSIILTAIITCAVIAGCYNPSVEGGPCHEITGQCTGSLVCTVVESRHVCTALGDGTEGSACGTAAPCDPGFRCVLQGNSSVCLATENRPGGACVLGTTGIAGTGCPEDYPCTFNNGSFTCSPPTIGSSLWEQQFIEADSQGIFHINDVHYYDGTWMLGSSCGNIFTSTNNNIIANGSWNRVFPVGATNQCNPPLAVNAIRQSGSTWRVATDAATGIIRCTGNCTNSSSWPENIADYDTGANVYEDDSTPVLEPDEIADIYPWGDHWVAVTRSLSANPKIYVYDEADNTPQWQSENSLVGFTRGMGAGDTDQLNAVRYGGGYWVAVGVVGDESVVYTSADSIIKGVWTRTTKRTEPEQANQGDVGDAELVDVHYGRTEWVAIGTNSLITSTVANDGRFDWREITALSSDNNGGVLPVLPNVALNDVHYDDGTWIVVGDRGTILRSTDNASTWESRTNPEITENNLNAVYYAPGTWVAVGDMGTIITSEDGMVWTAVSNNAKPHPSAAAPLPVTETLWDVHYGGGIWVIVGGNGDTSPVILTQYPVPVGQ